MYHNFFIHSSVDGHLGWFRVLAIIKSAAVNNEIHVSLSILVSSEYMPSSGIADTYGAFIPSFLRNLRTVFHSSCISLHSHQQCKRISFSPHPLQHFIFWRLFHDGHSDHCEMISHCGFDLYFSNDVKCPFMCLLAICMSSLEKCLFRSLSHFLNSFNHKWVLNFVKGFICLYLDYHVIFNILIC